MAFKCYGRSTGMFTLDGARFAVILDSSSILVLEHVKGEYIKKLRVFSIVNVGNIRDVQGNGSALVSVGDKLGNAEIWNYSTKKKLASLKVGKGTNMVRISEKFIAFVTRGDGTLCLHENRDSYRRLGSIDFKNYLPGKARGWSAYIYQVIFISDVLVVVSCYVGIYFVLLPSLIINACFEFGTNNAVTTITILPDGSIFAAGSNGFCATFQAPQVFREDMKKYAEHLYKSTTRTAKNSSSHLELSDVLLRKRTRDVFENEDETIRGNTRTNANSSPAAGKKLLSINADEDDEQVIQDKLQSVVSDLKSQELRVTAMEENANDSFESLEEKMRAEMRKMEETASVNTGNFVRVMKSQMREMEEKYKHAFNAEMAEIREKQEQFSKDMEVMKIEMEIMQEKSKMEMKEIQEATGNLVAELEAQKDAMKQAEEKARAEITEMGNNSQGFKAENEKMKQRNELLEAIIKNLLERK